MLCQWQCSFASLVELCEACGKGVQAAHWRMAPLSEQTSLCHILWERGGAGGWHPLPAFKGVPSVVCVLGDFPTDLHTPFTGLTEQHTRLRAVERYDHGTYYIACLLMFSGVHLIRC